MFVIRNKQMEGFQNLAFRNFENKMVEHIKKFFPNHFDMMQENGTRNFIRYGYNRAKRYGFTTQRNVCFYLNNMLVLGSHFDNDPQYPWAQLILNNKEGFPIRRIEELTYKVEVEFNQIAGFEKKYLKQALHNMYNNNSDIFQKLFSGSLKDLLYYLQMIFPEKFEAVGESNLQNLIRYGINNLKNYNITGESNILVYIVFMFLFGSGFDKDPQFPSVEKILNDTSIDQKKKMELLYKNAIDCLGKILLEYHNQ